MRLIVGIVWMMIVGSLLGGCFSFETATNSRFRTFTTPDIYGNPTEHILISNYGWFLFDCLPLACGNAQTNSILPWTFFSNDVTEDILQKILIDHAETHHARLSEIVLHVDDNCIFDVPGTSIPLMIPYLLTYREIQLSALAVLDSPESGATR